ncbi:MAG: hypothetical protein JKY92_09805 [Magnetovibrio sp.]|nr:hypothetical protein [Magnetovibrio sp.]
MDGLSPNDNTDHLILAAQAAKKDLMVVSHMPFVAKMAARCLTATEDGVTIAFKPGSVVCLEYIEGRWSLNWMMRP